jgi:hypothetical protein
LTYCKGKNHLSESLFQIFLHQYRKKIETPENKENAFLKQSYISLLQTQNYIKSSKMLSKSLAFTVQSSNVSTVIFMTNHSSVHQVCQISEQRDDCVYPRPPHAEEAPQVRACRPGQPLPRVCRGGGSPITARFQRLNGKASILLSSLVEPEPQRAETFGWSQSISNVSLK